FGTAGSPLADGYARVAAAADGSASGRTNYSAAQGYGWLAGGQPVYGLDRGPQAISSEVALREDFDVTNDGTFAIDVPNGLYNVTITVGDSWNHHDNQQIFLEGTLFGTLTTQVNEFKTLTYAVAVRDGQL